MLLLLLTSRLRLNKGLLRRVRAGHIANRKIASHPARDPDIGCVVRTAPRRVLRRIVDVGFAFEPTAHISENAGLCLTRTGEAGIQRAEADARRHDFRTRQAIIGRRIVFGRVDAHARRIQVVIRDISDNVGDGTLGWSLTVGDDRRLMKLEVERQRTRMRHCRRNRCHQQDTAEHAHLQLPPCRQRIGVKYPAVASVMSTTCVFPTWYRTLSATCCPIGTNRPKICCAAGLVSVQVLSGTSR